MKYDFTSILDRHGRDAIAIDGLGTMPGVAPDCPSDSNIDIIPMWVADMNFPVLPSIQKAMLDRINHPAFGYFAPTDLYFQSIIEWHQYHHQVNALTKECIGYENGVLGGVVTTLNVFCSKGDYVLLHSPTYIGFTNSIENNGYRIVHSPLYLDQNGVWRMDYKDMEDKIRKYHIHATVFCSPHNPCGRVWERDELDQAMALFKKYEVSVISDEIWSDIILNNHKHIPTQMISEDARNRTIALYAPSKTFNLAGLIGAYHIIYNPYLRERIAKESSLCHYNDMNVLSMHALIGAYNSEGYIWVKELCQTLSENINFAVSYIQSHFDGVSVSCPEGTYMLFLDCTDWCRIHRISIQTLLKMGWNVGVAWQSGVIFHGPCHIRMNLALPLSRVKEAFERLDQFVFNQF